MRGRIAMAWAAWLALGCEGGGEGPESMPLAEGVRAICAAGMAAGCRDNTYCTATAADLARLDSGPCVPLRREFFACATRPQAYACDALSIGVVPSCRTPLAAVQHCEEAAAEYATAVQPPTPEALRALGAPVTVFFEGESGVSPLWRGTVALTPAGGNAWRLALRSAEDIAGEVSFACNVGLVVGADGRYALSPEASASPPCAVVTPTGTTTFTFSAAAVYRTTFGVPQVWFQATAAGPLLGRVAGMTLAYVR